MCARNTFNRGELVVRQSTLHMFNHMTVGIVLSTAQQTIFAIQLLNSKPDIASKAPRKWTYVDSISSSVFTISRLVVLPHKNMDSERLK